MYHLNRNLKYLVFLIIFFLTGCSGLLAIKNKIEKIFMEKDIVPPIEIPADPNRPYYSHLFVLGDSLSDTGALIGSLNQTKDHIVKRWENSKYLFPHYLYFRPPFYRNRSFSNGPLAVEYLAAKLNLPLRAAWNYNLALSQENELRQHAYAIDARFRKERAPAIKKGRPEVLSPTLKASLDLDRLNKGIGENYAVVGAMIQEGKHCLISFT